MGVTAFKSVVNMSGFTVRIRNEENPNKPGNEATVPPEAQEPIDIWIPWCTSDNDLRNGKYIAIELLDPKGVPVRGFQIWQGAGNDGDFVRVRELHPPGAFMHYAPAIPIHGVPQVDGDRSLVFDAHGAPYAQY